MLSILIQEAIENRVAPLSEEALNLEGDPYGSDSRLRVQAQFWIAYQSSDWPTGQDYIPDGTAGYSQTRDLEFQHYVEVEDLRRDYGQALALHERLMGILGGFYPPNVPDVQGPLRITSDGVVSAKREAEVVYRYRATYRIKCKWIPVPLVPIPPFVPKFFRYAIWRSPVDQVAVPAPVSVKDAEGEIAVEVVS